MSELFITLLIIITLIITRAVVYPARDFYLYLSSGKSTFASRWILFLYPHGFNVTPGECHLPREICTLYAKP